jgi:hypothetical protein
LTTTKPSAITLKEILSYEKFDVDEAADGPEGIKSRNGNFDLCCAISRCPNGWHGSAGEAAGDEA